MARDLFNRSAELGGSFSADLVTVNFGALTNAKGAVVQRLVLAYQQAVQRLFEIGSPLFYYIGGRAGGEAALSKILGPGDLIDQFIRTYGDICSPEALQISMTTGCAGENEGNVSYACGDCVATSIGLSVQATETVVNQDCRLLVGWIAG